MIGLYELKDENGLTCCIFSNLDEAKKFVQGDYGRNDYGEPLTICKMSKPIFDNVLSANLYVKEHYRKSARNKLSKLELKALGVPPE